MFQVSGFIHLTFGAFFKWKRNVFNSPEWIANPCTPVRFRYSPPFNFKHLALSSLCPIGGVYSCVYNSSVFFNKVLLHWNTFLLVHRISSSWMWLLSEILEKQDWGGKRPLQIGGWLHPAIPRTLIFLRLSSSFLPDNCALDIFPWDYSCTSTFYGS